MVVETTRSEHPFVDGSNGGSCQYNNIPDSILASSSSDEEDEDPVPFSDEESSPSKSVRFMDQLLDSRSSTAAAAAKEASFSRHSVQQQQQHTHNSSVVDDLAAVAVDDSDNDNTTNYQALYFDTLRDLSSEKQVRKRKDRNLIKLAQELHSQRQHVVQQQEMIERYKLLLVKQAHSLKKKRDKRRYTTDGSTDVGMEALRSKLEQKEHEMTLLTQERDALQATVTELQTKLVEQQQHSQNLQQTTTPGKKEQAIVHSTSQRLQQKRESRSLALQQFRKIMTAVKGNDSDESSLQQVHSSTSEDEVSQLKEQIQQLQQESARQQQELAELKQSLAKHQQHSAGADDDSHPPPHAATDVTAEQMFKVKLQAAQRAHQLEMRNLCRQHAEELRRLHHDHSTVNSDDGTPPSSTTAKQETAVHTDKEMDEPHASFWRPRLFRRKSNRPRHESSSSSSSPRNGAPHVL